jgi:hypothetical protein
MNKIILSTLLIFSFYFVNAQRKNEIQILKSGTVNPSLIKEDWLVQVQNLESPSPDGNSFRAELQRRKALIEKIYPRKNKTTTPNRISSTPPVAGRMMEGNLAGNGTPNDNTMAISNNGIIVSAINSNLFFYDIENDSLLGIASLAQFTLDGGINTTNNKYDPKVIYDPEKDRFILVYLNGSSPASSKIIVAFSSTNHPMDPWNIYVFPGNPLNNNRWSDYPAIEVNEKDFFCTINLIVPGEPWQTGFDGTLIWECDKEAGYNGEAVLPVIFWDSLMYEGKLIRNIHPVRKADGVYNQTQYFLSNRNFSAECDSIFMLKLDGSIIDSNQTLDIVHIQSNTSYFVSKDALQPSGHKLATNDSRVLGGSWEGNYIQFVQNSTDTATGNSSIYHGVIDLMEMNCFGYHIASDTLDFGYPNMASTGIVSGEQEVMITFEYSSANDFPGWGVVYFDGGTYSPFTILKEGEAFINVLSDTLERWGDYSPTQRKYNEPCRVWASGTFGKTGNENGTWIAEISASDTCRTYSADTSLVGFLDGTLYPNPGNSIFTYDFSLEESQEITIEIYNVLGQKVKELYSDMTQAGENRITFNMAYLADGNYLLNIRSGEKKLVTKKFLVVKE